MKAYFDDVQVGDEVICLLFGKGIVHSVDSGGVFKRGLYFHVLFEGAAGCRAYHIEGIPTSLPKYANQTLFYAGTTITITPAP